MSRRHPGSRHHAALHKRRWEAVRQRVLQRDGWRCRDCGKAGRLEVDHVTPLEVGGAAYDETNLAARCGDCHRRKTLTEQGRVPGPRAQAWAALVEELCDAVS